jgi:hypothetical protein
VKSFIIGVGKCFFGMTSKAQETKIKIDRWDYIKLNVFCTSKKTRVKR